MTPADTTVQSLILWAAGLSTFFSLATAIWTVFSGPSRRNASRLEEYGNRLDDHDLRIGGMEQSQRSGPTAQNMHELEIAMEQLRGEIKTMSAVMKGQSDIMVRMEAILSRHDNHLLKSSF